MQQVEVVVYNKDGPLPSPAVLEIMCTKENLCRSEGLFKLAYSSSTSLLQETPP